MLIHKIVVDSYDKMMCILIRALWLLEISESYLVWLKKLQDFVYFILNNLSLYERQFIINQLNQSINIYISIYIYNLFNFYKLSLNLVKMF